MAKTITKIEVTLVLTEDEARYLRAMTQNYLGTSRDTEPDDNRDMRHGLFHALDSALKSIR